MARIKIKGTGSDRTVLLDGEQVGTLKRTEKEYVAHVIRNNSATFTRKTSTTWTATAASGRVLGRAKTLKHWRDAARWQAA